jgi:hypothetical protein
MAIDGVGANNIWAVGSGSGGYIWFGQPGTGPGPGHGPGGNLNLIVSSNNPSGGDFFQIDASVNPITQRFDAWVFAVSPNGQIYSFILKKRNTVSVGSVPYARNVNGLPNGYSGTIFAAYLPRNIPGTWKVVAGLWPVGATVYTDGTGAISGFFDQEIVNIY